jgi:hypothetical protein
MKRVICLLLTALMLAAVVGCKDETRPKITRISISQTCGIVPMQVEVYGAASGGDESGGPTGGVNNLDYVWNFGDGTSPTSISYHTYTADSLYTITLTVTDPNGLKDTNFVQVLALADSLRIETEVLPASGVTTTTPVLFDYIAASCDINPDLDEDYVKLISTWFVEDPGAPGGMVAYTARNPVHTFSAEGTFEVRLNVFYPAWDVFRNVTMQIVVDDTP